MSQYLSSFIHNSKNSFILFRQYNNGKYSEINHSFTTILKLFYDNIQLNSRACYPCGAQLLEDYHYFQLHFPPLKIYIVTKFLFSHLTAVILFYYLLILKDFRQLG